MFTGGAGWRLAKHYTIREFIRYALYTMESSDSDIECGALFGQIRPHQLEPYAARRPEGEEVAAGVDVVRVGNTDR